MSETKFTEGPWEVTKLEGVEGERIVIENDDRVLCDIFNINEIDKANANLIASSPELYEALEIQKLFLENMHVQPAAETIRQSVALRAILIGILAKARGEL